MSLDRVTPGRDVPDEFNVIIEIPMNADPIKYEVDKETGAMFVDRFMTTAMHYPCNYGYIPQTLADDGDPVDVLVITPFPLGRRRSSRCRPLGMLKMDDEAGGDAKLLAVPIDKVLPIYRHWQQAADLPESASRRSSTSSSTTRISSPASGSRSADGAARTQRGSEIRDGIERYAATKADRRVLTRATAFSRRSRSLERAPLVQFVQVALDARRPRARGSRRPRRRTAGARASAPSRSAPAAGRAPSCARPARRLRSADSRWAMHHSIGW